jgi:hypothetical protein
MSSEPHIEVSRPKQFTASAILAMNCHALLALIPVLILAPAGIFVFVKTGSFPALAVILALTAFLPVYFFPLILGNAYVKRLVNSIAPTKDGKGFVVQVTMSPRIHKGVRALADDADDVGRLSITDSELVFDGDAVKLRLPLGWDTRVETRNVGWRGMWICGPRIWVVTPGPSGTIAAQFCDRSSLTVPASRKNSSVLKRELLAGIRKATGAPA